MTFDFSRLTATCAVESPDKAITLPPEAYGSDDLYADEVDRIFKRGWIPLCRVEQVGTPGSYYSIDFLIVYDAPRNVHHLRIVLDIAAPHRIQQ